MLKNRTEMYRETLTNHRAFPADRRLFLYRFQRQEETQLEKIEDSI
jgi:hypothetical protein